MNLFENRRFFNKFSSVNRLPALAGRRFSQIAVYFFGIRISLRNFADGILKHLQYENNRQFNCGGEEKQAEVRRTAV